MLDARGTKEVASAQIILDTSGVNLIILTGPDQISDGQYRLDDNRAEHILKILKLRVGDRLEIGILNGRVGTALIESVDDSVVCLSDLRFISQSAPDPGIDIVCALPRPQILKRVLFNSAMLGVRHMHLIRANRVEKSYFQSPVLHESRIKALLIEGLSQGKRTRLPTVQIHERFRPFFEDFLDSIDQEGEETAKRLLPDLTGSRSLADISLKPNENVIVAIGPEGGWVPFEIELMESRGFEKFILGSSVLRVDSALTASISQLELIHMMQNR